MFSTIRSILLLVNQIRLTIFSGKAKVRACLTASPRPSGTGFESAPGLLVRGSGARVKFSFVTFSIISLLSPSYPPNIGKYIVLPCFISTILLVIVRVQFGFCFFIVLVCSLVLVYLLLMLKVFCVIL